MAKERMVTRTLKLTEVEVMTIDTTTAEVRVIPLLTGVPTTQRHA